MIQGWGILRLFTLVITIPKKEEPLYAKEKKLAPVQGNS